jgi:hypothetical protein
MTEQVKIGLALGALLLSFVGMILAILKKRSKNNEHAKNFMEKTPIIKLGKYHLNAYQSFTAVLLVAALFGTVNYNRYSTDLIVNGYDEYDLLHYYINAKYFKELGYFRLLPAMIIATDEAGPWCTGKAPVYLAQDDHDYKRQPVRHAFEQRDEIKSHFTKKRWEDFVSDVSYIQRKSGRLRCSLWRQLLQDHGFNGTPSWVLIARPIVNLIPVEQIKLATLIDLFLIIIMTAAVFWAFGADTGLYTWIFITVGYSFRWPTITWVLLRYDWVTAMVIGICLIKKKKHYAAGALFGYATLMRYFPGLWLFGIAAKGIHSLITCDTIPWSRFWLRIPGKYYKMAAGFFATLAVILTISFAVDGINVHRESFENMSAHVEAHNLSSMRQGLAIALTYRGETDMKLISAEKKEMVAAMEKPLRYISIAVLIIMGLFLSRTKDWEATGYGLIPYFFLTTSSYYYYSMRLTAIVIHAQDLSKPRNVAGLVILFGIELFCHASQYIKPGNRYFLISIMGLMLLVYSLTMIIFLGYQWWSDHKQKRTEKKSLLKTAKAAKVPAAKVAAKVPQ